MRSRWEGADPPLSLEGPGTLATHGQVSAGEAEWLGTGQPGLLSGGQQGAMAPGSLPPHLLVTHSGLPGVSSEGRVLVGCDSGALGL